MTFSLVASSFKHHHVRSLLLYRPLMRLSVLNLTAFIILLRAANSINDTEHSQKSSANQSHLNSKLIAAFAVQEIDKDQAKEEQVNQNENQGLIN